MPDQPPQQDKIASDIRTSGLITRLPAYPQAWAVLMRLDRPIGWWLLLLPGWWALPLGEIAHQDSASPEPLLHTVLLMLVFLGGAIITRAAGCIINDLWDRDLDARVARTRLRPIASGAITPSAALAGLGLLGLAGLAILLMLPLKAVLTGLAAIPLVILYPLAKRVTGFPQLVLALTFSWGGLLGWAAHGSWPGMEPAGSTGIAAIWLYLAAAFWVFGYDTIYAIQDRHDDAILGIGSSAISLGRVLPVVVSGCYAVMLVLLVLTGQTLDLGFIWYIGIGLAAIQLGWQCRQLPVALHEDQPQLAGRLFRSNRDCGLIISAAALACLLST